MRKLRMIFLAWMAFFVAITHSTGAASEVPPMKSGFKLLRTEEVKEVNGTARFYEHEKSGARLMYLSNDDDNKVFSIGFKTIPEDSTGIAHILEHSVLAGSRKFPTKEPFLELVKGSLQTFVNAMTWPDKTVYPIASRNAKDFMNLMDVYMDAVLYPLIYSDPLTLKQEGWRYEIDPKTGAFQYNGVVYNEMKGAYSSPERLVEDYAMRGLYPKTPYARDSGGDPKVIPNLTQKAFEAFHRKYYHPSNSYIFIYGDGDIDKHLEFLDREYLSKFTRDKINSDIAFQKTFSKPVEKVETYSVNLQESLKDKTFLNLSYAVGRATDPELMLAMDILEYLLLETPASPLKRALLDAGVGKDVSGAWEGGIQQPYFSVRVRNSNPEKKALFLKTTEKTLKDLVKNGIDRKLMEASLNRKEFLLREFDMKSYPKGLIYDFRILDSWIYGGDPLANIRFEPLLERIKKEVGNRYFEKLIETYFLKNQHRVTLVLKPERGLDQKEAKKVALKLKAIQKKLKKSEMEDIRQTQAALIKKQQTPDLPENLAKIPLLTLKDVNPKSEVLPREEKSVAGVKVLFHPVFTNKIGYLGLYFDISAVPQEKLGYLSLLSDVLGHISTEKYSFQDLSKEIDIRMGGYSQSLRIVDSRDSLKEVYPKMLVEAKALLTGFPQALELVEEILLRSKFDDKARLKEIIQEAKASLEAEIPQSGNHFALLRNLSYFSKGGAIEEATGGVSFYQFLTGLEENFDKKSDEIVAELRNVRDLVFNRNQLLVSFTTDQTDYGAQVPHFEKFLGSFPEKKLAKQEYVTRSQEKNEALVIPSLVQYVCLAADYRELGEKYSGKMQVLRNILGRDYLWNRVRVQGGAYGASAQVSRAGLFAFTSYRDPNLKETWEAYRASVKYLKEFSVDEREMRKYILGTVSDLDRPLTPSMKGFVSANHYIAGVTQDDIQKTRDAVLETTPGDIQKFAGLVEKVVTQGSITVVGGEKKVEENRSLFRKVIAVLK